VVGRHILDFRGRNVGEAVAQVPFGTIINAINGKVTLTTVGPKGRLQTITYHEGMFRISQSRNGQVVATLVGGNFSVCGQAGKGTKGARASATRGSRKRTVRKLWGNGHHDRTAVAPSTRRREPAGEAAQGKAAFAANTASSCPVSPRRGW